MKKPSDADLKTDRATYKALVQELKEHDHAYHVLDRPIVSDYEYDQLFQKLIAFESTHPELIDPESPSFRVGGAPLDSFSKVAHSVPMLSLGNSYNPDDIRAFHDRAIKELRGTRSEIEYFCEPKFDGLAIELVYQDGVLVRAITRGDGVVGEDVTANVKTVRGIPLRLKAKVPPRLFEVRGEMVMLKKDFHELNEFQEANGDSAFANPRNAAAGTIRQLDPKITAGRKLTFFSYALGLVDGISFESQMSIEETFAEFGLPVVSPKLRRVCKSVDEVIEFYFEVEKLRPKLEFDIDGIVIKANDIRLQDDLGMLARTPRWATAAKYKPEQATTIVENIIVQVGRTGAITPVAIMKSVKVGGVTVTNATLHNEEELKRKDVRVGDTVVLQRAGDVIPEIVSVDPSKRAKDSLEFSFPTECPECQSKLVKTEGEVAIRCENQKCPAIVIGSIIHFCSRRAMNIDKVGDKIVESLVRAGLVKKFSDLYRLTVEDILTLERQGEKSSQNIIDSIEASKKIPLRRLIYALGIRYIGEQTAKHLADHFKTFDAFLSATEAELLKVPEIGEKVAVVLQKTLRSSAFQKDCAELIHLGVDVEKAQASVDGPLSGKSFLITGTLPVKRDEAKDFIEKNGGKILSGVSAKLNYLVVGDDPGSKVEKATKLKVSIISWEELQGLVG